MTDVWYAQARRVHVGDGCGAMNGGPPRAVHHTTEGSTIDGAVATYKKTHNYPTFTIDYAKDDVVQHIPVNVGATAVKNAAGGVDTNREGSVCIQVEWVGKAEKPFTTDKQGHLIPAGPKVRGFFDFLRAHGIPDVWPEGAPLAYPGSYGGNNGDRHPRTWTSKAGHYGHSQVPENEHGDPGALDPTFIKQTAKPPVTAAAKPAPATTKRVLKVETPYMQGSDVLEVAHALAKLGYPVSSPPDLFGSVTHESARRYQAAKGLVYQTGEVGVETRRSLGLTP
jgi:hypothetical protein